MGNCIMSSNLIVSANFYLFLFAMFYSYILLSEKDGKYYYGSTNNLQNRLLKHNKGDVKSTKHRRPLKIHFFEEFNTRSEAFQREHFYKSIVGYNWLKQNNIILYQTLILYSPNSIQKDIVKIANTHDFFFSYSVHFFCYKIFYIF
jgi:putative endonuclease